MRSISRPHYPPPIISPATFADIPDLVRVQVNAERPNLLHQIAWPSEDEYAKMLTDMFTVGISYPSMLLMKAVDADTNEITALAMWQQIGYEEKEPSAPAPMQVQAGLLFPARQNRAFNKFIDQTFRDFLDAWATPTKHLSLVLLMTDPKFQRRGIATALLEWGHRRADLDRVPAFLIASPVGHPLYQSRGWKDVSVPFEIDLKDWVDYAKGGDMGWGTYRFYYMLRLPLRPV
ncbi:hypothetical protein BP6252_12054 [Coleophoma cylindrospora]|uniref:N-acetyltransferase domain-containing protein n=1 Tax=Coleophoma cylindrospora TaxID=1849047 RepID=A0A3D8QG28_9HELO|nr:hypothetical protein BP6252_12054 [Coleophoma cylindrospora]